MNKLYSTALYSIVVSFLITYLLCIYHYTNQMFVVKGLIFGFFVVLFVFTIFYIHTDSVVSLLILVSFFNVPIKQLYTSSTNILILIALSVLLIRYYFNEKGENFFKRIKNNKVSLPLILVICSYTISLFFVKKDFDEHFIMYQSIICGSLLIWLIVGTVHDKLQIRIINNVMLAALLMNIGFSFLFILSPEIDTIRAQILSLNVFEDEAASRLQGLSFRGEAYAEYLMICGLWLFTMLIRGQFNRGKFLLWILTATTVIMLIMTRSRGANTVFFLVTIYVLFASRSLTLWRKMANFLAIVLILTTTLYLIKTYSGDVTLLDRFYEFSDIGGNVGYVPETRYYTWVPTIRLAISDNFMGRGPSFMPYAAETEWKDIVADQASGNETTWPHNIILIVLCTVGFYGLLSYVFLIYRAIHMRKIFPKLDIFLQSCFTSYLICLVAFLIEGQKFDGILRHPTSSLYFIFVIIAIIFSSQNIETLKPEEKV